MTRMTKDEYAKYLKSPQWKAKRQEAIAHHGTTCQRCGTKQAPGYSTYYIRVHHKSYEHLGNEPMEDLEVLCVSCHEKIHDFRDKAGQRTGKGQQA